MGGFSGPPTREKMESLGHHTRGTYRGPLSWHYCMELYDDLQQARREDGTHVFRVGSLFIVSQDEGYNIVYTLTEEEYQQSLVHHERTVKRYMRDELEYALEPGTGEVIPTLLAEDACRYFDEYGPEPDRDIPESYFDWALEIAQEYEEVTR